MRQIGYEDLNALCRGITSSFVHLETRDAYGTEVELPHLAKWRRGEADDLGWLAWWLQMLRDHRPPVERVAGPGWHPSRWLTTNAGR